MTPEEKFLESWNTDYTNGKKEQFYEKSKVCIMLSEYAQMAVKNFKQTNLESLCPICNSKKIAKLDEDWTHCTKCGHEIWKK